MAKFAVVLPAAGRSSRFQEKEKKPFVALDGRAVWLRTADLFVNRRDVCQVVVVVAADDRELFQRRYDAHVALSDIQVAPGGSERFESIANALALLKAEVEFVAVHDAVRPCLTAALVDAVFARAEQTGAAMLAVPVTDTVKQVDATNQVRATIPRAGLWLAQTPQVFRRDWLIDAYARRQELGDAITDDAQLVEAAGHVVHVVAGATSNLKITTRGDLALAEAILASRPRPEAKRPAHPFADEDSMWGKE